MNKLNVLQHARLMVLRTKNQAPLPAVPFKVNEYHKDSWKEKIQSQLLFGWKVKNSTYLRHMSTPSPVRSLTIMDKLRNKFNTRFPQYRSAYFGTRLFECMVDRLNYTQFYKEFNMADTFFSWFLVTELHVWMLMCRAMAEEKNGKVIRHNIVDSLWLEVNTRVDLLGKINASVKKKQLRDLSQQFYAAIIEYDEGIMSDDKVLAGALWRIFFNCECNNPEHVEKLVIYVRKQMNVLDKVSFKEIKAATDIKWLNL